ncbi:Galactokinase [Meira miltonrushii]|uniref:Galactokinase n=1 Tax=Meira miltonrushii TaxID=1280837 RepID=A0A316V896_9BASI|nr:Galactokinase [Meira miltonrushii]PWN33809.1 Galactokinase [Meira miltonrushii]
MPSSSRTTQDPIPSVDGLDRIYSKQRLAKEGKRWDSLHTQFKEEFDGDSPHFIARAPGRVNLMGDHVDHMRFSCLPAALEIDILMAVRVHTTSAEDKEGEKRMVRFNLHNTTKRFEPITFESDLADPESVQLLHEGGARWANYFKVAYKGLYPHLPEHILNAQTRPTQIDVLVDGTIPPESSLSSSAAMTTCSSIVVLEAFQARNLIGRREMAEVAIESERLVGVNSGGMDQAASIFGVTGSALHISFEPELDAVPTKLPVSKPPHVLLIANTLVVSDKKVMGPVQYNLRVCELMMACRALAKKFDLPQDESTRLLKPLTDVYFAKNPLKQGEVQGEVKESWEKWGEEAAQLVHLRELCSKALPEHALSRAEVEEVTGIKGGAYEKQFLSQFPVRADTFALGKRVQHVFNESLNVLRFKSVCQEGGEGSYKELGNIMHASQQTLFNVYENACPELEAVCQLAESNGALGCRPTGAGWGGSTVSLVEQGNVEKVINALRTGYYAKKYPNMTDEEFADAVLVSQPAQGACIYAI